MTSESSSEGPDRLQRKLERERRARLESEQIAENITRELYDAVQALQRSDLELRRAGAMLALLQQVAIASNEALNFDEAAAAALDAVCGHTSWPVGHLYLVKDQKRLVPTSVWHVDDPDRCQQFIRITEETPFASGEGLPGRVLLSGRPAWVADLVADNNFPRARAATDIEVRSGFAFPVVTGDEVCAVLEFFAYDVPEPSSEFLDLMAHLGRQLGRVIERDRLEARLERQALYDHLTGLANRVLLIDRLTRALARRERGTIGPAVLFIDLDGFKLINDSFGHAVGDLLLQNVAGRVAGVLRPTDTLSRPAGDEFVVILEQIDETDTGGIIADRIRSALDVPVELNGESIHVSASIGLAVAEEDSTPDSLITDADAAMYTAKRNGRGRVQVFGEQMRSRASTRLRLENQLREATTPPPQLELYYQPVIRLETDSIGGVEALIRWNHPERGLLAPIEFIKLAEDTGLIVPIGTWVLADACRQAQVWQDEFGFRDFEIAVNLSARQIAQADFVDTVSATLDAAGIEPGRIQLCLEITETVLMGDPETSAEVLKGLQSLGFHLAIDDFGTGYSSLAYLRTFPVDLVKLDRTFINGIVDEPSDRTIVGSVIQLAHALGLTVVAEGVEEQGQLEVLKALGCDLAQGFLFAKPQPAALITELFAKASSAEFS